jgi:hypothetical protein
LLPQKSFEKITKIIHNGFDILPGYEHAIALDPRTVIRELATTLATIRATALIPAFTVLISTFN